MPAVDEAGDPSNTAPVEAKLVQGEAGSAQLVLTPSMEFLEDPKTEYPTTIDPDIAAAEEAGDTYYFEGQAATDSRGSDYRLRTGYQDGATHRSLVTFGYKDFVGENVTKAELKLHQYSSATCTAKESNAFPTLTDTVASITWANRPTIDDSSRFKGSKSFNHGQGSCPDAWEAMDVTSIVSAWAGGAINSDLAGLKRQGIELRASSESDGSHDKRFCSRNDASSGNCDDPALAPVLSVTYAPELGDQDWYSMTAHQLNAASTLSINNRSGNAYVSATDGGVNARGVGFGITRAYNSQSPATTSMGKGWNLNFGADVWIEKKTTYRYDYHGPDGAHFGSFFRQTADSGDEDNYLDFDSPLGGVGADLDQDFDGSNGDHTNDPAIPDLFTMTMNDSQTEYRFLEQTSTGHAYLSSIVDRSGNEMTFTYDNPNPATGVPKLTGIEDAGGRTYAVTSNGSGYITQISEDGGLNRDWAYAYSGDYLVSYTDPDNKVTNYAYDTGFAPDLLETITNPGPAGERPTTTLDYPAAPGSLNVNQATKVSYVLNGSITYDYTWDYFDDPDESAECDDHDHGDFATNVTDPNAGTTSFCFKHRTEAGGDRKMYVYDGVGNSRTDEFNVDNQTQILTAGSSSTVATYAGSKHDQLMTVTDPSSGTSGERTNIDYDHDPGSGSSSPKGEDWLPASVTDANNDCIRYEYDSLGRLTEANTELRGSGTDRSCADATSGGVDSKFEYNSDGTLAKSADANVGSSTNDAEKTIYTYWATGDTGFVVGSEGLIKSVRKPGGNCATDSNRKLCKSYTYDAGGRVTTVTDGNGIKTTMEYDKLDRTTQVLFNGATTCLPATCNEYTYDAEGNLTSRVEAAGTTSFTYDRMNRQTAINQPGSITFAMAYDGVGNLTGYTQDMPGASQADTVSYGYDKANSVTGITDTSGTIVVTPDDDGRSENIHFPGAGDIEIDLDFKDNGKPESAEVRNTADGTLLEYKYDYTDGSDAEDQLQSRQTLYAGSALNGTINYEYDNGRLAAAADSSSAGRSYDYEHDNIGNVTEETKTSTTTHFGYDLAGQLCWSGATTGTKLGITCPATPSGNTTLTHDAAGNNLNTTADPTSYNNQNQVTNLDGLAMGYLDLGNDRRTTAGPATLVEGPLGISARKIGTDITWYTRMPDGTILNSRTASVTQNYFTEPHNNSVAALYSPSGARTATYIYSPYGDTTVNPGGETGGAGDDNPFRYISGFQDTDGAEDYYKLGARYYDGHGHFTQPDPVAGNATDPRTMTAYNYAAGDPINRFDPSGLYWGEDAVNWAGNKLSAAKKKLSGKCGRALLLGAGGVLGYVGSTVSLFAVPLTGGLSTYITIAAYWGSSAMLVTSAQDISDYC